LRSLMTGLSHASAGRGEGVLERGLTNRDGEVADFEVVAVAGNCLWHAGRLIGYLFEHLTELSDLRAVCFADSACRRSIASISC